MKSLSILFAAALLTATEPAHEVGVRAVGPGEASVTRETESAQPALRDEPVTLERSGSEAGEAPVAEPAREAPPHLHQRPDPFWSDGVMVDPDVRTVTGIGPEADLGVL